MEAEKSADAVRVLSNYKVRGSRDSNCVLNSVLLILQPTERDVLKLNIQKLRSWHLVPSLHGK